MKRRSATVTLEIPLPNYNREAFMEMLIAGENIVPWTNRDLLIDEPFFHSHEGDVQRALEKHFTRKWRKRKYAAAVREAELLREELKDEENLKELLDGCDAVSIFKRRFKFEMRDIRIMANIEICRCWVKILKHRPEYVDRCPWRFFQGDRIWQTLRDEELLRAINYTPLQLAKKMDLNAMTSCDWDEAIKIVPELAARRPKEHYDCYVE
ncbi:MAG: hypothetical protein J6X69_01440 [Bacteroidales bacterium]|nr:hypothetical protein [Bacteroidales bacterium]